MSTAAQDKVSQLTAKLGGQRERIQYTVSRLASLQLRFAATATGKPEGDVLTDLISENLPPFPAEYLAIFADDEL